MTGRLRFIFLIISGMTVLMANTPAAGDSVFVRRVTHDIELAASGGYNLPTHGYYNGYNPDGKPVIGNSSLHLRYGFSFTPMTHLGKLYPDVIQGAGLSASTFFEHKLMGSPVTAYIFQKARLFELKPGINVNYSWELGLSTGWKRTEMIATTSNVYVNVGIDLSCDISRRTTLSIGPEFSHFSNGDTCYPNGGANLINIKAIFTSHLTTCDMARDRSYITDYEIELKDRRIADRISIDLIALGGWRAGKVTSGTYASINETFPVYALAITPLYRLNRHLMTGVSLDLLADRSANLYDIVKDPDTRDILSYRQPPVNKQMAVGMSLRMDISMPIFTVGAGVGGFVLGSGNLRGIYSMFSLKTFLTDRLFLNVTYRLSAENYTHNLLYGIGYRL